MFQEILYLIMDENKVDPGGPSYRDGWILVNHVPTHVLTWGGWIEEPVEGDSVMLCITGTPGLPDFYITFLSKLYECTRMPIWIINYAGKFLITFFVLFFLNLIYFC